MASPDLVSVAQLCVARLDKGEARAVYQRAEEPVSIEADIMAALAQRATKADEGKHVAMTTHSRDKNAQSKTF
jgi:hypothetical protein